MAVSTGTKLAAGGTAFVAAGTPASIYIAKDHIFLYAVEREVISKKIKLEKKTESDNNKAIVTVKTPDTNSPGDESLSESYSWSCIITIEPQSTDATSPDRATNLWEKLKKNLPVEHNDKNLENKELLVWACSKDRQENATNSSVIGKLVVKEINSSEKTFSFEKNPELNVLLETVSSGG